VLGRADGGAAARQGALDQRVSAAIITTSECAALLAALVILLSMIVNVSALLIPAGIALAFAAKDLSHNFVAGAVRVRRAGGGEATTMRACWCPRRGTVRDACVAAPQARSPMRPARQLADRSALTPEGRAQHSV